MAGINFWTLSQYKVMGTISHSSGVLVKSKLRWLKSCYFRLFWAIKDLGVGWTGTTVRSGIMQIIQNKKKIQGMIKIDEGVIFADALDHYLRVRTAMSGREVRKDEPFQIIKHITHKWRENK